MAIRGEALPWVLARHVGFGMLRVFVGVGCFWCLAAAVPDARCATRCAECPIDVDRKEILESGGRAAKLSPRARLGSTCSAGQRVLAVRLLRKCPAQAATINRHRVIQAGRSLSMDRTVIYFCMVSLLAGCQGSTTPVDPFAAYGPTRIPPPATGSAQQGDPYYRGTPSATTSNAAGLPTTAQALPPTVRFTSNTPPPGTPQVADSRSAAVPGYGGPPNTTATVPTTSTAVAPSDGGAPPTSGRRLDWRSPMTGATAYPPNMSPAPQAPQPTFPTAPPPSTQNRY